MYDNDAPIGPRVIVRTMSSAMSFGRKPCESILAQNLALKLKKRYVKADIQ